MNRFAEPKPVEREWQLLMREYTSRRAYSIPPKYVFSGFCVSIGDFFTFYCACYSSATVFVPSEFCEVLFS